MYKDSFRYDKATLCQTALRSSSYFQGTCYRASFTKEDGGESSALNEISFPSLSSRLIAPCCQSWGTPSTRAHFIKCHFGPHFTLWPALLMQRKQTARCSLCLLPQQRFIHYSKKTQLKPNFQAPIQNQVPPAWSVLPQDKVLACLQLTFDACLSSPSPAYSYLLSLLPKPAGIWTLNGRPPWQQ